MVGVRSTEVEAGADKPLEQATSPKIATSETTRRTPATLTLVVAHNVILKIGRMTLSDAIRDLLATGPLGHVVTLDPDGTPHVTLAWVGVDGNELVWATFFDQHKLASLRRDQRIVISFQAIEHTGEGLHPYLVVEGRARITEGGALAVMDRLAEAYIGPGERFPQREFPEGFVVHVTVDRVYGIGPWARS